MSDLMNEASQTKGASESSTVPVDEQTRLANREAAIKLYQEGIQLVKQGDWATALTKFQSSINVYDRLPDVFMELARCYTFFHKYGETLHAYRHALKLRPAHAPTHVSIGVTYRAMGDLDMAMSEYQEALRLDPGSIAARLYSSTILVLRDRSDEAIALAQEAVSLNTNVALSYSHLGTALFYAEKKNTASAFWNFGAAREAYYHCLSLDPNDIMALTNLAIIREGDAARQEEGASQEAEDLYHRALQQALLWNVWESVYRVHKCLANFYMDRGRLILAAKHAFAALRSRR